MSAHKQLPFPPPCTQPAWMRNAALQPTLTPQRQGGGEESPWFTELTSLAGLSGAGEAQGPQEKSQQPPGDSGIGRRRRFLSQNPTSATK